MAANILTILTKWSQGTHTDPILVEHALSYAPGCDDLDMDDFRRLYTPGNSPEDTQAIATELLPKYEAIWHELGEPQTAEDWKERKYHVKGVNHE